MDKDISDIYKLILKSKYSVFRLNKNNYTLSGVSFSYNLDIKEAVSICVDLEDDSYWEQYYKDSE